MGIEYRIKRLTNLTFSDLMNNPSQIDTLQSSLDNLGNDDWEVYKIEEVDGGLLIFMLKRI